MGVTVELLFRIVFSAMWVIFLTIFAWLGYLTKGSGSRRTTRRASLLRVGALAFAALYFAGALLYLLLPGWVILFSIPLPDWVRSIMVGVAALGILLVSMACRTLGDNWAPSVSGVRKDTVLVTNGLYGSVRHPIYSGAFIFLAALALIAANSLILLTTLALLGLLYISIGEEEALLIERFGDEYCEYMKRTPRFVPKLRHRNLPLWRSYANERS